MAALGSTAKRVAAITAALGILHLSYSDQTIPHGLSLSGIFSFDGERYAAVEFKGPILRTGWFGLNDVVGPFRLAEIESDSVTLEDLANPDRLVRLPLKQSVIVPTGEVEGDARLKWIHSASNPMASNPMPIPHDVVWRWPELTEAEQSQIKQWYRDHGWALEVEVIEGSLSEFRFEHLYPEYRQRLRSQNHQRFEDSLTDRQREIRREMFEPLSLSGKTSISVAELDPETQDRINDAAQRFESSLTPEQRALRQATWDFTKTPGDSSSTAEIPDEAYESGE